MNKLSIYNSEDEKSYNRSRKHWALIRALKDNKLKNKIQAYIKRACWGDEGMPKVAP